MAHSGKGSAKAQKRRNLSVTSDQMPKTKLQLKYFFWMGNMYQNVQRINKGDPEETFRTWAGHTNSPVQVSKLVLFTLFLLGHVGNDMVSKVGRPRTDQMLCFPPF